MASKLKFQRGDQVTVVRDSAKPHLVAGEGTVFNVLRINGKWVYVINFADGRQADVTEARIQPRQGSLFPVR